MDFLPVLVFYTQQEGQCPLGTARGHFMPGHQILHGQGDPWEIDFYVLDLQIALVSIRISESKILAVIPHVVRPLHFHVAVHTLCPLFSRRAHFPLRIGLPVEFPGQGMRVIVALGAEFRFRHCRPARCEFHLVGGFDLLTLDHQPVAVDTADAFRQFFGPMARIAERFIPHRIVQCMEPDGAVGHRMSGVFGPLVIDLLVAFGAVCAELSEQVQTDFEVVEGVIVMPINDEYIVDLDEHDNLHVGDILTLVNPGRKIFHPETREVLGSVDDVAGFLRVTRIHSGYSYAKTLSESVQPDNGASLKRFEQVPALFVDATEDGSELARQIKVNLPQVKWLEDNSSDTALLIFTLQGDALEVRTAQGDSLHRYMVTDDQQLVSTTAYAPRPNVTAASGPKPGALQQFANSLMGTITETNEERFAKMDEAIIRQNLRDRQGIWMGPNLSGHPTGLAVADFDGDGLQEIAIAIDKKILIGRIIDGKFTQLAEVDVPGVLQLLSIDALDLDGNGRSELYLSALKSFWRLLLTIRIVTGELLWPTTDRRIAQRKLPPNSPKPTRVFRCHG